MLVVFSMGVHTFYHPQDSYGVFSQVIFCIIIPYMTTQVYIPSTWSNVLVPCVFARCSFRKYIPVYIKCDLPSCGFLEILGTSGEFWQL